MLELLVSLGHGTDLLIGGGLTLHGQICDVCVHVMLSRICKADELACSLADRVAHPGKRPPASKQDVLSRGERAYGACNCTGLPDAFKKVGVTNALDGSEDWVISDDLLPTLQWNEMDAARKQIRDGG